MQYKVVAVLVFCHVLDVFWAMSADGSNGLEDVHFSVLDDLLDASVGGAVDSAAGAPVRGHDAHGAVVCSLAPSFHHVHQLH